jgi:hypothetical protein
MPDNDVKKLRGNMPEETGCGGPCGLADPGPNVQG